MVIFTVFIGYSTAKFKRCSDKACPVSDHAEKGISEKRVPL